MRISLVTRAARACAAATVVFSLSLAPSFARMGGAGGAPLARPASGGGHFHRFAPRGVGGRFAFDRFGFNRFGPNGLNRFRCFGSNCFNGFGGNQLVVGGWGWDGWGGVPASIGPSPIIAGDGAPVIIKIGADSAPSEAGDGYGGACVTHKLLYDGSGKYVGERQTAQC